ncbi:hypothetical protein N7G274_000425 [Stereocaulon virgatum]|uniref:Uncharacterized protein n=1 Tax=Stereocaulon virgatum TaxID=373712 RepID=A0ABR4ATQ3_9LECA
MWSNGYEKRNPGAAPYDRKTAKHFMEGCCTGKKQPSLYYMLQKWTDFGAGCKRRPGNDKFTPEVSESIYFYVQNDLRKKILDFRRLAGPGTS